MDAQATRADIEAAYSKLAAEVGDLYFTIETQEAQLEALKDKMLDLKQRRAALQKAYQEAPEPVLEAVSDDVATTGP